MRRAGAARLTSAARPHSALGSRADRPALPELVARLGSPAPAEAARSRGSPTSAWSSASCRSAGTHGAASAPATASLNPALRSRVRFVDPVACCPKARQPRSARGRGPARARGWVRNQQVTRRLWTLALAKAAPAALLKCSTPASYGQMARGSRSWQVAGRMRTGQEDLRLFMLSACSPASMRPSNNSSDGDLRFCASAKPSLRCHVRMVPRTL